MEAPPEARIYAVSVHALIRDLLWSRQDGQDTAWLLHRAPVDRIGFSTYIYDLRSAEDRADHPLP